jgi:hypothetical protein
MTPMQPMPQQLTPQQEAMYRLAMMNQRWTPQASPYSMPQASPYGMPMTTRQALMQRMMGAMGMA